MMIPLLTLSRLHGTNETLLLSNYCSRSRNQTKKPSCFPSSSMLSSLLSCVLHCPTASHCSVLYSPFCCIIPSGTSRPQYSIPQQGPCIQLTHLGGVFTPLLSHLGLRFAIAALDCGILRSIIPRYSHVISSTSNHAVPTSACAIYSGTIYHLSTIHPIYFPALLTLHCIDYFIYLHSAISPK
jgi:hypothetical protein